MGERETTEREGGQEVEDERVGATISEKESGEEKPRAAFRPGPGKGEGDGPFGWRGPRGAEGGKPARPKKGEGERGSAWAAAQGKGEGISFFLVSWIFEIGI